MSSERHSFEGVLTAIEYGYETGFQAYEHEVDLKAQTALMEPMPADEAAELGIIEIHSQSAPDGADRFFIPGVAGAELKYRGSKEVTAELTNLKVHPDWRSQGFGSLLFENALEAARNKGSTEFEAVAANERTAHCFRGRVPEEHLSFYRLNKLNRTVEPLDLSLDGVILFLANNRRFMPPDARDDAQLADHIPRVLINAKLI